MKYWAGSQILGGSSAGFRCKTFAILLALVLGSGMSPATGATFREDTNRDGAVNLLDMLQIVLTARQGLYQPEKDYNQDGSLSADDVRALGRALSAGKRTPQSLASTSPQLTTIDGGTFRMGNNEGDLSERPEHDVTVSSFKISRHEITNKQFAVYLNEALALGTVSVSGDSSVVAVSGDYAGKELLFVKGKKSLWNRCWIVFSGGVFNPVASKENWPVVYVTWYGAASAVGTMMYATGDGMVDSTKLNYDAVLNHPTNVGSYPANQYALHDMSGNVWEYCSDYFGAYPDSAEVDPTGPAEGDVRSRRGGGWNSCELTTTTTARTDQDNPDHKGPGIGFRVAADTD
jgi:formylglycine-generating enzyme required for sulfatase activity